MRKHSNGNTSDIGMNTGMLDIFHVKIMQIINIILKAAHVAFLRIFKIASGAALAHPVNNPKSKIHIIAITCSFEIFFSMPC